MRMWHPDEQPIVYFPLTVACGKNLVQTSLVLKTFDFQGRTLLSIHLMLAGEQQHRPGLTLVELEAQYKKIEVMRPNEWYAPGVS